MVSYQKMQRKWQWENSRSPSSGPPRTKYMEGSKGSNGIYEPAPWKPDNRGPSVPQVARPAGSNAPAAYNPRGTNYGAEFGKWAMKRALDKFGPMGKTMNHAWDMWDMMQNLDPYGGWPFNWNKEEPAHGGPGNADTTRNHQPGQIEYWFGIPPGASLVSYNAAPERFVWQGGVKLVDNNTKAWVGGASIQNPCGVFGPLGNDRDQRDLLPPEWGIWGDRPRYEVTWNVLWQNFFENPSPTIDDFTTNHARGVYAWVWMMWYDEPIPPQKPTVVVVEEGKEQEQWPMVRETRVAYLPWPMWHPSPPYKLIPAIRNIRDRFPENSSSNGEDPNTGGGGSVVPPGVIVTHPPGPGNLEKKRWSRQEWLLAAFKATQKGFHALTEYGDASEAVYDALPDWLKKELKKKYGGNLNPAEETYEIIKNWHLVNADQAVKNLLWNQVEDHVIGKGFKSIEDAHKRLGGNGSYKLEQPVMEAINFLMGQ